MLIYLEQCSPGTFARRKLLKQSKNNINPPIYRITLKPFCRQCNIGFYQPDYGQTKCISCPEGYTTTIYGSNSINQCTPTAAHICSSNPNICNKGTCVVINEYQYTCKCYTGYIGTYCERFATVCDSQPCLNGGTCILSAENGYYCKCPTGYKGRYCQTEDQCYANCLNNGVCVYLDETDSYCNCPNGIDSVKDILNPKRKSFKGFSGERCEIQANYCFENLCENNGTCIEAYNTYKCNCVEGFFGRRCHILPCDYKPCSAEHVCVNVVKPNTTRNDYK